MNANGNKNSESRFATMRMAAITRPRLIARIISRLPPAYRSMIGPMRGLTTANGAIVRARYKPTLHRAALGSIEKNNDPANATVIIASPAAHNAWTRLKRTNGETINLPFFVFGDCRVFTGSEKKSLL